jgi:hypothetical protein
MIQEKEDMKEIVDFEVFGGRIKSSTEKIVKIVITPKKQGHLRIEGIKWKFLDVEYTTPLINNVVYYQQFKITAPTAQVVVSMTGIEEEMLFGQIQQGVVTIENRKDVPVSDVVIFCEEPLFTGFRLKKLGPIPANSSIELKINLRATMIQMQELCFTLFYKSELPPAEDRKITSP